MYKLYHHFEKYTLLLLEKIELEGYVSLMLSEFYASHAFNKSWKSSDNVENLAGEFSRANISATSGYHGNLVCIRNWCCDFQSNLHTIFEIILQ